MAIKTNMTVEMDDVKVGDYLTGLDNGYVIDVEAGLSYGNSMVTLTFHDKNGEECTLTASNNMDVDIYREN